jgi:hypothetical protein
MRTLSTIFGLTLMACSSAPIDPGDGDQGTGNDAPMGGTPFDTAQPTGVTSACNDPDSCNDVPPSNGDAGATTPPGWVAGATLLTRGYTNFHKSASSTSPVITTIAPNGGVADDTIHLWGSPLGMITPAQKVKLVSSTPTNGFYEVTYDGATGWIGDSKLLLDDETKAPLALFLAFSPSHRNAFFKRQTHRDAWNKDGPYESGTCAPTSLAMALRILDEEPKGLSVEQSIHSVRESFGDNSDLGATQLDDIYNGATKLGANADKLWTQLSPSDALTRVDHQLAKGHLVQLAGLPGQVGSARTKYEQAFDDAYATAGLKGTLYSFDPDVCGCDGYHSILVAGKDADGTYIVGDPMSEIGFVNLQPAELKDFFARWSWGGTGNGVY